MRPIIFLDIDGVLNRCGRTPRMCRGLESGLITNLKHIVDTTDCGVVLSSTWRLFPHLVIRLTDRFDDEGVGIKFLGHTPDLSSQSPAGIFTAVERGLEIQTWLDRATTPSGRGYYERSYDLTNFAILDDSTDMAHLEGYLVKTDSYEGLTTEKAEEAIGLLLRERVTQPPLNQNRKIL